MSEFIVLGIIPGTSLQINFAIWIALTIMLVAGMVLWVGYRTHVFRNWLIAITIFSLTKSGTVQL